MTLRRLMTACMIAAGIGGSASMVASPAHAQSAMEAEIIGGRRDLRPLPSKSNYVKFARCL